MDVEFLMPEMHEVADAAEEIVQIAQGTTFAEGPVWDRRHGCLYFTDIIEDTIWRWTPGVGKEVLVHPTGHADGMTIDHQGRLIVAGWGSRTVWRREADETHVILASHFEGRKINTPNDIVVHSSGDIYWTDGDGAFFIPGMAGSDIQRYQDRCNVFRIAADGGAVTSVIGDFVFPNGITFSPDETRLYVNDTRVGQVRVFDVRPDGSVGNGRLFYELAGKEIGHADGMKVDRAGRLFCTGPAGIHVLAQDGRLIGRIRLPAECTNMAWGDEDWRSLYVTTHHVVFRLRLKTAGVPVGG